MKGNAQEIRNKQDLEEKKAFLQQYRILDRQVRRLEEEIARWESLGQKVTASISKVPGGGSGNRISSAVEETDILVGDLRRQLRPLVKSREQIEKAIAAVSDEEQALVLRYYYIDGLTLEETAERMNIGYTWTWQLRNRAINEIILPECIEVNTENG